jgi:hypothetical protein
VEGGSVLKNPLGARLRPRSGTKQSDFGPFGARFVAAIGSMPTFSTRWWILRSLRQASIDGIMLVVERVNPLES